MMIHSKLRKGRCFLGVAFVTVFLSTPALPAPAETGATPSTALAERLHRIYPSTHFGAVNPTPWPGVFEVVMGAKLSYVDASGHFFLFGHLYDMQGQRDITAEHQDLLARIDFSSLPLNDALKEVRGSGKRSLVIFSDPDCPYCRRLEATLKGLTDITLYTFLMPLPSLHPAARGHAIAVWCAADRIQAWHTLMGGDQKSAEETPAAMTAATPCAHPVDRNIALGERLGISGTPTLVAADGRALAGAGSLAQIEAWLGASTASAEGPTTVQDLAR